jgi:tetratricopeptide (TPR) repeat protein
MLAKKNRICGAILFLTLAIFISGCTPPGPRALLEGKKCLDRGDYAEAVAQFRTATTLLPANAQAWNYLGVACQRAGQPADAVAAYTRALALDRDLMEAHYNLGCLWLEQNKTDAAMTEFTACTLRRPNDPQGWLKLGSAQLHAGEIVPAEKSFSTARSFDTNNAEALNGLGLARIERELPREAARFFTAAIQRHPDYAPAYLNLAAVSQQYLHDNRTALQNYRAYLALQPRPPNWDEVNAVANALEQAMTLAATKPPPVSGTKTQAMAAAHQAAPKPTAAESAHSNPPPPAEVVQVEPEPVIVATPVPPPPASATVQMTAPPVELPLEVPPPAPPPQKSGFWHAVNPAHWFGSSKPEKTYEEDGVTPLPDGNSTVVNQTAAMPVANPPPAPSHGSPKYASASTSAYQPVPTVAAPGTYPRYTYLSPRKPKPGNHAAAAGAFTQAQEFEQDSRWPEAMQAYQQAATFDPGWFEAQYNFGTLAYRLQNFAQALAACEIALVDAPDATNALNARYQFALALKAAGYVPDALNELKKVVAASPNEARAHLALGNLYAQQLHDPAKARPHYEKVLELDPDNPLATDIRFWLAANPK